MNKNFLIALAASLIALGGVSLFLYSSNRQTSASILFRCLTPSAGSLKLISDAGEQVDVLTVSEACEISNLRYPDNWTQSNKEDNYIVIDLLPTAPFIIQGEI